MFRRAAALQGHPATDRSAAPATAVDAPTTRSAAPATPVDAPTTRSAAPATPVDAPTTRSAAITRRRRPRARSRQVATGAAGAAGAGMLALARMIRLVASLLALVIAAGMALIALDARSTNSVVSTVHDAARWLVGPFDGMFSASTHKLTIAINWGIPLVLYLIVGSLLAGLVARAGAGTRSRAIRGS